MKVQFVSDVHCEFHNDHGVRWASELPIEGDVLILAGDITTYVSTTKVCKILAERFPYVIYVCGNHEYYMSNRGDIHNKLTKVESQHSNFFWLNNKIVTVDGQRFIGSTLWWDAPPIAMLSIRAMLNDFATIQGYKKWVNEANREAKSFLEREVQEGDVVITHHAPTWQACPQKSLGWGYAKQSDLDLDWAYYNNLDPIIETKKARLWIFGHTHDRFSQHIFDTLVVNSPHGYARAGKARADLYSTVDLSQEFLEVTFNGEYVGRN